MLAEGSSSDMKLHHTLRSIPFHAILWRDLTKVSLDDLRVAPCRQTALVRRCSEILLAVRDEFGVDATAR